MIQTAELWKPDIFLALGPHNDPITVGRREPIRVPAEARKHYVWAAAGASEQQAAGDHWWAVAHLEFYLKGNKQGEFWITDHSADINQSERDAAPRQLIRFRGDAAGSTQPVVRWQDIDNGAGYKRDNLDIPAFCFELQCDQIVYVMDKSYYDLASLSIRFVTGLRVLSM